ncbi:MAG: biotin/lipoyl-binding protein [Desulfovibrio sp.]|nr:biotin/lipoyl-binding protein [Desulfovibrio sp.]
MQDESRKLEMPQAKQGKKSRFWIGLFPLWGLVCCAAALAWWLMTGRVASSWAMLDAMVVPLAVDFSGKVKAVEVREGDHVREGQIVARLEVGGLSRELQAARHDVQGLRTVAPPADAATAAASLKEAQAFEQGLVRSIAAARHEEEAKRKLREEKVAKHVQAQLALRSLESQGGVYAVGQARYEAAKEAESHARRAMEQAVADFEQASLARAAMDQEMARLREENLRYRQMTSRVPNYTREALGRINEAQKGQGADGNLYAPRDGLILRTVAPGQTVKAGEPLALLLPGGDGVSNVYWILAYFPQSEAAGIKAGQKCSISVQGEEGDLSGSVYDVLKPQPLPDAARSTAAKDANSAALHVPVRILVDKAEERMFKPGLEARCVVSTRTLWQ